MKEIVVYALLLAALVSNAFGQDACDSARKSVFKRENALATPTFSKLCIFRSVVTTNKARLFCDIC